MRGRACKTMPRPLEPRWEEAPKFSRWRQKERFLDEINAVLAEEHFLAHEEGRRAEHPARHSSLGGGLEPFLDVLALHKGLEVVRLQAGAADHRREFRRLGEVLGLPPHGVEDHVAIG